MSWKILLLFIVQGSFFCCIVSGLWLIRRLESVPPKLEGIAPPMEKTQFLILDSDRINQCMVYLPIFTTRKSTKCSKYINPLGHPMGFRRFWREHFQGEAWLMECIICFFPNCSSLVFWIVRIETIFLVCQFFFHGPPKPIFLEALLL